MLVDRKPLDLTLHTLGPSGNAFALMGRFHHQAELEGWTPEEIETVLTEAKSANYEHLVGVLSEHCVNGGSGTDDDA